MEGGAKNTHFLNGFLEMDRALVFGRKVEVWKRRGSFLKVLP